MAVLDGKEAFIEGEDPVITESGHGQLKVSWPLRFFDGTLIIELDERQMVIKLEGKNSVEWFMDLSTADKAELPFINITKDKIGCNFKGMEYSVGLAKGFFSQPDNKAIFRMLPQKNMLEVNF